MIVPLTFSPPADSAPCDLLFNSVFHDRSTQWRIALHTVSFHHNTHVSCGSVNRIAHRNSGAQSPGGYKCFSAFFIVFFAYVASGSVHSSYCAKVGARAKQMEEGRMEGEKRKRYLFSPLSSFIPLFRSRANACYAGYKFIVKTTSGMWFTRMTDGTTRTPDSNRDFPNNFWRAEFFCAWVVAKCGIKYFEFILQPVNTFLHFSKSRSRSLYLSFENLNWMLCIWTTTAAAAATT